jgi:putative ABC transport system permease protein
MTGVALKGLLGRKTRALLTALAIVLGVAMIGGTFILTDTMQKAFTTVFSSSYKNTNVVVSGKEVVKESTSGKATVPASLLAKVRALPDVAAASGEILDFSGTGDSVKLIDAKGDTLGNGDSPTFGFGIDPGDRFNPLTLTAGRWASGPRQVVIDNGTATKHDYAVGDTIRAAADGPTRTYAISGIAKLGDVDSIGGATIAVFDVATAQALLNKQGAFDAISTAGKPGVSDDQLAREIARVLPPSAQVQTGAQQADADAKEINSGISFVRYLLLAFGGIALFVGAFVIFNTISITVAQRAREFATLRTLGASRRQVLRSVLVEAGVIGFVASVIGLFLGLALAYGLNALFVALGVDLPQAGTVVATRTIVVCLLVGTLVTLLAGLFPAIRATRVPPIAAVREGAVLPPSKHAHLGPYIALGVILLGLAAIADGLFLASGVKGVLLPLGAGTLLLFVGIALVSSRLVRPLAALVGQPALRFGGSSGRLARENAVRNTGRTASTAAALMIGLALVTFVATLGKGLRASDQDALSSQVRSQLVVSSGKGWDPFPSAAGDTLAAARGVTLASSVRGDKARIFGQTVDVVGVGPEITRAYHFDWTQGSDKVAEQRLGPDGAIVSKSFADSHHLLLNDLFVVQPPSGERLLFAVQGVVDPPKVDQVFGDVIISRMAFDAGFPRPKNTFTFVNVRGDADAAAARLQSTLGGYPGVDAQTKSAWVTERANDINTLLNLLYVLLALSVIVSLFGMVNTLVLSVFERTRELGMLRAVGMTQRQVRRMVRHESVITALIGAALGVPLGLFLAALVTRALSGDGVSFHVPGLSLVVFALVAVVAGVVAAILPARRAARLNVLQALQYE